MDDLSGDNVFKVRRPVAQRDEHPPPSPPVSPPAVEMVDTELGPRPKAEWDVTLRARKAHAALTSLKETDYVVTKSMEAGRKLSTEWLAWRQELRDIANGSGRDVTSEPDRWAK